MQFTVSHAGGLRHADLGDSGSARDRRAEERRRAVRRALAPLPADRAVGARVEREARGVARAVLVCGAAPRAEGRATGGAVFALDRHVVTSIGGRLAIGGALARSVRRSFAAAADECER